MAGWRSIVCCAVWFGALPTLATGQAASLFVVNQDDATISVIDTSNDTVAATIPVAFAPAGIASDRAGKWLYVTHPERGEVSVIDAAQRRVVRALAIGGTPLVSLSPMTAVCSSATGTSTRCR